MMVDGARDPEWKRTWTQITHATRVHKSTLKRMARVLKKMGEEAWRMSWTRVSIQQRVDQFPEDEDGQRNWKETRANKMAEYLAKGPNLMKDPEITAMALAKVSTQLPQALVEEWWSEAMDIVLNAVQETVPDKAEAAEEALWAARGTSGTRPEPPEPDAEGIPDTATVTGDWATLLSDPRGICASNDSKEVSHATYGCAPAGSLGSQAVATICN